MSQKKEVHEIESGVAVRMRIGLSKRQSVDDIPELPEGRFYLTLIDFGWDTDNSKVMRDNKRVFGEAIGEHVLIEFSTQHQTRLFAKLYNIDHQSGPYLFLSDSHPRQWNRPDASTCQGIVIDFSKVAKEDIVPLFQDIVNEIDRPRSEFYRAIKWDFRLKALKKALRGKGLLSIVLFLFDWF